MFRQEGHDWSAYYAAIGEFVVAFEQIPTKLRFNYSCMLQWSGLKHWDLGANLLNLPSIGPAQLAIAHCAAVSILTEDKTIRAHADEAVKRTTRLAEQRNEIVHGEWLMGPRVVILSDTPDMPERMGIKRKTTRAGATVTEQPTIKELTDLTAEC